MPPMPSPIALACSLLALLASTGCAESELAQRPPPFEGRDTESWTATELAIEERTPAELTRAFEASARARGCRTENIGSSGRATIGGRVRGRKGVVASCEEGTVALVFLTEDRASVGCAQPTTRSECNALLLKISEAR